MFVSKRFLYTETSDSVGAFILKSSSLQVCGSPRCCSGCLQPEYTHTHTVVRTKQAKKQHTQTSYSRTYTAVLQKRPKETDIRCDVVTSLLLVRSTCAAQCYKVHAEAYHIHHMQKPQMHLRAKSNSAELLMGERDFASFVVCTAFI